MDEQNQHLLEIKGLTVHFETEEGTVQAADRVNFNIGQGEIVGLVGESGSGKTVTSLSILKLIPSPPGFYRSGSILFERRDLLTVSPEELRRIRGGEIAFIFQDPMTSLNPVKRVGHQIAEAITLHQGLDYGRSLEKAVEMMEKVGIPSAAVRVRQYPHQFSGGMRQRVMIAMALSCNPKLLIADEPTTALDVTIQAQVLDLMRQLWQQFRASILFITHDLGIIAEMCQRVVVMYGGRIAEIAPVGDLFLTPFHPYTQSLLKSRPKFGEKGNRLSVIPGMVPNLISPPTGCRFHPRCCHAMPICKQEPPVLGEVSRNRHVACHLIGEKP